ncbi:15397_t:CDS:2, partial [Funneliformis geosporum]
MQDQATSSIIFIDDTSDDNNDERIAKVSNYTATNIQVNLKKARRKSVKANIKEKTGKDSVSKSLAQLYQKVIKVRLRITKVNQEEITCWYNYAKGCENIVKAIRKSD